MDIAFLTPLKTLSIAVLIGAVYVVWAKIPPRQKQREEGERIIAKKSIKDCVEIKKEFRNYFKGILRWLVFVALMLLIANILLALAIDIFLTSQNVEFFFFEKIPVFRMSSLTLAIIVAFMMCSAGWLITISLFYHSQAAKMSLETKYEDFFRED